MSVVNQVSICNAALVMIGAERISSIDQDCKSARVLKAIYDQAITAVLRARKWNFAKTRVSLVPNGTVPAWGYNFTYDIPNDYVGWLETDDDTIIYTVEGGKILTDENTLNIGYIYRNTDESSYDPSFANAVACLLARDVAYVLTQSTQLVTLCDAAYKAALAEASFNNSAEKTLTGIESTTWTDARKQN